MEVSKSVSAKIAEYLLQINAIKLQPENPFTWASGWKSPIYSDNRLSLSHPEVRNFIKKELARLIITKFPQAEAIVGVATAGIAPGVLVADELSLPFGYVRSEAKKHGMAKQVEGDIKQGQKVLVIEDLVSTGKSSLQAVNSLRDFGADVIGMASIFTYGFDEAVRAFADANCEYVSLCNYNTLISVAVTNNIVKENQLELLAEWRKNPSEWGQ
ncbi:MAG: orotate phosphoribosyltransferase [Bacteroidetes bacterium]|jgi:orotate phosphoribosyltransferase|nr:orotate phosphoribosyltransferase [Bacteroidota bacterium]